jgi:hypothetical protein
LSDAPHWIEVDWHAATAPGSNDGGATLYLDDSAVPLDTLSGLDNDTLDVDKVTLGYTSRLDGKLISGTWYIDDVVINETSHIGGP